MKHLTDTIREALDRIDHNEWEQRDAALTALSELEAMAGEPVYWQWRRKGHDWTLEYTFANEVQVTTEDSERRALYTAAPPAQQPQEEHLTITWDEQQTRILAVSMQDEEGRILKVLAEAPAQQTQYEAGDMASAHNDGFRAGVASVAQQPPEIEVQCPVCNHKFYEWPKAQQPQAEKRCQYCDGTGDVHSIDGQWCGECHCQKQPQAEPFGYVSQHTNGSWEFSPTPAGVYPDTAKSITAVYTKQPQAEAVRSKPVRVCHIKDVACSEAAVKCGECPEATPQQAEAVKWGVDWGTHGDRTCVSIIKKHSDGTIEVVANEYEPEANVARKAPQQPQAECRNCGGEGKFQMYGPAWDCRACNGTGKQPQAVPPANCRQRLKHDGKAYPRSSCAACGEFSPKWKECDAAMAQGEKP